MGDWTMVRWFFIGLCMWDWGLECDRGGIEDEGGLSWKMGGVERDDEICFFVGRDLGMMLNNGGGKKGENNRKCSVFIGMGLYLIYHNQIILAILISIKEHPIDIHLDNNTNTNKQTPRKKKKKVRF